MTFPQKVLKIVVFSLLFEIAAAVDEGPSEPGEPGESGEPSEVVGAPKQIRKTI